MLWHSEWCGAAHRGGHGAAAVARRGAAARRMATSGEPVRQLRRGPAPIASFDHDGSDEVRPVCILTFSLRSSLFARTLNR